MILLSNIQMPLIYSNTPTPVGHSRLRLWASLRGHEMDNGCNGSFFCWEKPWEKPMKNHSLLGRRGTEEGHVLTSCIFLSGATCVPTPGHAGNRRSLPGAVPWTTAPSNFNGTWPSWPSWDGRRQQFLRGGEIRHGQDGGLCAGLPAEFRDLQERRKPRDAKSPDGAVGFSLGGWLVKNSQDWLLVGWLWWLGLVGFDHVWPMGMGWGWYTLETVTMNGLRWSSESVTCDASEWLCSIYGLEHHHLGLPAYPNFRHTQIIPDLTGRKSFDLDFDSGLHPVFQIW